MTSYSNRDPYPRVDYTEAFVGPPEPLPVDVVDAIAVARDAVIEERDPSVVLDEYGVAFTTVVSDEARSQFVNSDDRDRFIEEVWFANYRKAREERLKRGEPR